MKSAWKASSRKRKWYLSILFAGGTLAFSLVLADTVSGNTARYTVGEKILLLTSFPITAPILVWLIFTTNYPTFIWNIARKISTSKLYKKIAGNKYNLYMENFKKDWIEKFGEW